MKNEMKIKQFSFFYPIPNLKFSPSIIYGSEISIAAVVKHLSNSKVGISK